MLDKIKKYRQHPYISQLKDVRMVGLLVFGVISLLVTWSSLGAIQTNYVLQQQINRLEQQAELQEVENANLRLRNEYYDTERYLELTARRQFGLGAPGEKLLLVPKEVALSHAADIPQEEEQVARPAPEKPRYQQNFEAWIDFLFHRR
jgi:cell division protein FtsB